MWLLVQLLLIFTYIYLKEEFFMKRIAVLLATIIFLSSFVWACALESVNATSGEVSATADEASAYDKEILEIFEKKHLTEKEKNSLLRYLKHRYDIGYDGDDNTVLVYLTEHAINLYKQGKIEYNIESFKDIGAVSVVDIQKAYDYTSPNMYMLLLYLDKHDKQNVLDAIEKLNQREDILCSTPNIYLHSLNSTTAKPTVTPKKDVKKANPMKVTAKSKTVKAKKLKKSKVTVSAITVKDAKGKVTYRKLSGSKKLSVTKKGKITVKKGTKKGAYKIKVKITAKGNSKYLSKSVTKTVRVKVK